MDKNLSTYNHGICLFSLEVLRDFLKKEKVRTKKVLDFFQKDKERYLISQKEGVWVPVMQIDSGEYVVKLEGYDVPFDDEWEQKLEYDGFNIEVRGGLWISDIGSLLTLDANAFCGTEISFEDGDGDVLYSDFKYDIPCGKYLLAIKGYACKQPLLPRSGLLSFFYEEETAEWGYSPSHKGCARVYYFAETKQLVKVDFPEDLGDDFRNPEIGIQFDSQISYPSVQDIQLKYDISSDEYDDIEDYMDEECCVHQVLGWPGIIQNNISTECELIQKGYELGNGWKDIPKDEIEVAQQISLDKWQLLFQLDEVEYDDFYLSFGDSGRLYFYILKEDLKNCNFDNVWLVYQCF